MKKEGLNGKVDRRIEALLRSQEKLRESQKKTDEQINRLIKDQEKTDEQLQRTSLELREMFQKTDLELRESQKKTDEQLQKTDTYLKNLAKTVGDLTNGWGKFVIGLTEPGIKRCLQRIGFSLYSVLSPPSRKIGREEYEIDLLCPSALNGNSIMIVIEAKSYFNQQKLEHFLKKLPKFHKFFPEYGKIELIGAIAGIRLTKEVISLAPEKGLYLFSVSSGIMKSLNPKGFKPMIWR